MHKRLQELRGMLTEVSDLRSAAAVLHWDQTTYMPAGGADSRARQISLLERLAHERFIQMAIGEMLEDLREYEQSLPYDSDDASLIRVTRKQYERESRIPVAFQEALAVHCAHTYQEWTQARPANDFARVRPLLEKTLDMSRELAGFYPGYDHIADPLIEFEDEGMTVASLRKLFAELRGELVSLVRAVAEAGPVDDTCLTGPFATADQLEFGRQVIERLGYDFSRGRQDLTHHPYMIKFSLGDVRITTRVRENDLGEALFGTIHESGHAMYEQGIDASFDGTPLAHGTSSGIHESQSRLWENVVGRSRHFWTFFYPALQSAFPGQLSGVTLDDFYRAVNSVEPSLIRTEADELTYNLHVMIRFDLETAMLEGKLAVRDLPEAWNERYRSDLGVLPPDNRDGVLQDVHWFGGIIGGAFQGYTLGNVFAALFMDAATRAHPEIPSDIERGEFAALLGWLRDNIYRHGSKFTADELAMRITGNPPSAAPYVSYLKKKYGAIYGLGASG
jgi:carboxypeptidase Taq